MRSLGDELHHQLTLFLADAVTADELLGWLASAAPEITRERDSAAHRLWGTAFLLLSELSSGDIDEEAVRRELRAQLGRSGQPVGDHDRAGLDVVTR